MAKPQQATVEQLAGQDAWRVEQQTLSGGLQHGVQLIEIDNGKMQITVVPTRGMSVLQAVCGDVRLGWNSPVTEVVHPSFINHNDRGGLGWLAGFNELLVRCGVEFAGAPGEDNGTLLTLHGRIGNLPADHVQVDFDQAKDEIILRGRVVEGAFKFGRFELWTELVTQVGSQAFSIRDRLVNVSDYAREYQIIYHSNFGPPLLQAGSEFEAPVNRVAPIDEYSAKDLDSFATYLGPTKDYGEQVYCLQLNDDGAGSDPSTVTMLRNKASDLGVALEYRTASLPCFTLWKNTDTLTDGYVTGLEPSTSYPYNRSVERENGRVPKLEPHAEVEFGLQFEFLSGPSDIQRVRQRIAEIQAGRKIHVHQYDEKKRLWTA